MRFITYSEYMWNHGILCTCSVLYGTDMPYKKTEQFFFPQSTSDLDLGGQSGLFYVAQQLG